MMMITAPPKFYLLPNMSPSEAVATMSVMESEATPTAEAVVYRKFGEMELHEEEDDDDYSPSEADSDDSLEWASETERTMAEDALAEGTVGLDFYGAAVSVATEYVSSYKPVQMGLSMATILPAASSQLLELQGGLGPRILKELVTAPLPSSTPSTLSSPTWASTWSLMWRILPNHTSSLALSHSPPSKSSER